MRNGKYGVYVNGVLRLQHNDYGKCADAAREYMNGPGQPNVWLAKVGTFVAPE